MERMLITGGAGFIGFHCVKHFAGLYDVVIVDNLSRKMTEDNLRELLALPNVRFERLDVRDVEALQRVFREYGPFAVILHLAGQVAVTQSVANPREDFEINALGTFNVLEAFRLHSPEALFMYASTNKVYGALEDLPLEEEEKRFSVRNFSGIDEKRPLDFHSPYGCSKGAADQYVVDFGRIYHLTTVSFRQSCIYGPQQFGVEDQGWVAWFTIAAHLGLPVTIYGNGKQVRDLLYIDDLVDLYDVAIRNRDKFFGGTFMNIGGGFHCSLSLLELIDVLKDMGYPLVPSFGAWRPGDQKIFISSNTRAEEILGWRPRVRPHEGVERIVEWVRKKRDVLRQVFDRGMVGMGRASKENGGGL
ncbi:GDP-mannose 4,6-dehydratase [Desulfosoma sp.]